MGWLWLWLFRGWWEWGRGRIGVYTHVYDEAGINIDDYFLTRLKFEDMMWSPDKVFEINVLHNEAGSNLLWGPHSGSGSTGGYFKSGGFIPFIFIKRDSPESKKITLKSSLRTALDNLERNLLNY